MSHIFSGQKSTHLLVLLTSLVLAWATPAHAAREADALADLYRVARLMDATVLDLNMLLGEERSPTYSERLDDTISKLDAARTAAASSLASAGIDSAEIDAVASAVTGFRRAALANRDSTLLMGMPEGAVLDEMMLKRKEARKALNPVYEDLEKRAGLTGSPLSEARALALLLQQMSALYVETAASAGGISYRTLDSSEDTIDALARQFDKQLTALLQKARGEEAIKRVRGIEAKWRFIEKSMLNYREKTVPFLVDRYTQVIVVELMAVADLLQ